LVLGARQVTTVQKGESLPAHDAVIVCQGVEIETGALVVSVNSP